MRATHRAALRTPVKLHHHSSPARKIQKLRTFSESTRQSSEVLWQQTERQLMASIHISKKTSLAPFATKNLTYKSYAWLICPIHSPLPLQLTAGESSHARRTLA